MKNELLVRRVSNLLAIKSLVTLSFTAAYVYLLIMQLPIPESFQNMYLIIIGFYFGSQAEKIQARAAEPRIEVIDNIASEPILKLPGQGVAK